jgi:predicted alpha/beta hydrolase
MQTLAVAAVSARAMAEAAAQDGFDVVVLDLFGDLDTRRAASRWLPIGAPGSLHIDGVRVLAALRELHANAKAGPRSWAGWRAAVSKASPTCSNRARPCCR